MSYSKELEPALKDITLEIEAGMKVGVVGRTGSGKSSLLKALFRFFDCDPFSSIEIDGIDIFNIPLRKLRQSISFIPQSPFLFSGTLR